MANGKPASKMSRKTAGKLRLGSHLKHENQSSKDRKSPLETTKEFFEAIRSISLSIMILITGSAVAIAVGRELFSSDVLIDVTELSKSISDTGVSAPTLAAELAARVRAIQAEASTKAVSPTVELAYILQSENTANVLPTLPSVTQNLLVDNIDPVPELVTSGADQKIRTAINYIKHVFGRDENRLSISLTTIQQKKFEARVRLRRNGNEYIESITADSVDDLLTAIPRWLAKELFPEASIISQFERDRRGRDKNFAGTIAALDELAHRRGLVDDTFVKTIQGDIAFYRESYPEAEAIYSSIIASNIQLKNMILYRLSQTLVKESKPREALILLSKAHSADLSNRDLVAYLAMVYAQEGVEAPCLSSDVCLSESAVSDLLLQAGDSAAANNILGVLKYKKNDRVTAEQLFRKAKINDAKNASTLNNLGVMLLQRHEIGEALLMFNNAAAIEQNSGVVQLNLGNALESVGRAGEAAQHFQNAVLLERGNLVCHACLALSLINVGRLGDAQLAINDGINADPKNTSMIFVSAILESKLGCYQESVDYFKAASQINDPRVNNATLSREYGDLLIKLNRRKEAISVFEKELLYEAMSEQVSDELNSITADIYAKNKSLPAESAESLGFLIDETLVDPERRDENRTALIRISTALVSIGENQLAVRAAQHAVEIDPKSEEAHKGLGEVYEKLGQGALARAEFRSAFLVGGEGDGELLTSWTKSLRKDGLNDAAAKTGASFRLDPRNCSIKRIADNPAPTKRSTQRGRSVTSN